MVSDLEVQRSELNHGLLQSYEAPAGTKLFGSEFLRNGLIRSASKMESGIGVSCARENLLDAQSQHPKER